MLRIPITNGTAMNKTKQRQDTVYLERPNPKEDDVTHINIHHKAKSDLGRMLSHYYEAQFIHPYFGPFASIEGLWHYLKDGCRDDAFRNLNGHNAKQRCRSKKQSGCYVNKNIPIVAQVMLLANYAKLSQHPEIKELLVASKLPFDHYYLFGEDKVPADAKVPIRPRGSEWLPGIFEELRNMFREGRVPEELDYVTIFANY